MGDVPVADGSRQGSKHKSDFTFCVVCNGFVLSSQCEELPRNFVYLRSELDKMNITKTQRSSAFLRAMQTRQFRACKSHHQGPSNRIDFNDAKRRRPAKRRTPDSRCPSPVFKPIVHAPNKNSTSELVRRQLSDQLSFIQESETSQPECWNWIDPNQDEIAFEPEPIAQSSLFVERSSANSDHSYDGVKSEEPLELIVDESIDQPLIDSEGYVVQVPDPEQHFSSSMALSSAWDTEFVESLAFPVCFPSTPDLNMYYDYTFHEGSVFHV